MEEPSEGTKHPLTRMATITRPSFWVFIASCITLYIINVAITPDTGDRKQYVNHSLFIFIAAFVGLFLNLITPAIKNEHTNKIFNKLCLGFEIGSVVLLARKRLRPSLSKIGRAVARRGYVP